MERSQKFLEKIERYEITNPRQKKIDRTDKVTERQSFIQKQKRRKKERQTIEQEEKAFGGMP